MRPWVWSARARCMTAFALLAAIAPCCHASAQLPADPPVLLNEWSTDYGQGPEFRGEKSAPLTYGPDGPWQAILADAGEQSPPYRGETMPFWPSPHLKTQVWSANTTGHYVPSLPSPYRLPDGAQELSAGYFLDLFYPGLKGGGNLLVKHPNISLAVDRPYNDMGRFYNYSTSVGILGIGPEPYAGYSGPPFRPSLISQFQMRSKIASRSFAMHMGSVLLEIPGSMAYGGYDRSLVVGNFGEFNHAGLDFTPVFMTDVAIGFEIGASPFKGISQAESVYRGLDRNTAGGEGRWSAAGFTKLMGGRAGSAVMVISPEMPYLYMPLGTCEAAAEHLPVVFDEHLKLYLWKTEDPYYERIVNSSAWMRFSLESRTGKIIDIKVPFKLLNLQLEPPLVESTTPYFPCRPIPSIDAFYFGRAFLQAAYVIVNYDNNVTIIAQAPGPDSGSEQLVSLQPDQTNLEKNNYFDFADSWKAHWNELSGESTSVDWSKVYIGTSAVAAILCLGAVGFYIWRRGQLRQGVKTGLFQFKLGPMESDSLLGSQGNRAELGDSDSRTFELESPSNYAPPTPQSTLEGWDDVSPTEPSSVVQDDNVEPSADNGQGSSSAGPVEIDSYYIYDEPKSLLVIKDLVKREDPSRRLYAVATIMVNNLTRTNYNLCELPVLRVQHRAHNNLESRDGIQRFLSPWALARSRRSFVGGATSREAQK
ncbi:hypothetical protein ACKVWH_009585 [Pyricularia oryzae]|nr:hypothetical protein PoMZ_06132 [Pyricularia oryzae]